MARKRRACTRSGGALPRQLRAAVGSAKRRQVRMHQATQSATGGTAKKREPIAAEAATGSRWKRQRRRHAAIGDDHDRDAELPGLVDQVAGDA